MRPGPGRRARIERESGQSFTSSPLIRPSSRWRKRPDASQTYYKPPAKTPISAEPGRSPSAVRTLSDARPEVARWGVFALVTRRATEGFEAQAALCVGRVEEEARGVLYLAAVRAQSSLLPLPPAAHVDEEIYARLLPRPLLQRELPARSRRRPQKATDAVRRARVGEEPRVAGGLHGVGSEAADSYVVGVCV